MKKLLGYLLAHLKMAYGKLKELYAWSKSLVCDPESKPKAAGKGKKKAKKKGKEKK